MMNFSEIPAFMNFEGFFSRYVTVKFPVYGSVWCRVERARVSVMLVFIVTTIVCIPNIITVTIKEIPFESEEMYLQYASENDISKFTYSWKYPLNFLDVL